MILLHLTKPRACLHLIAKFDQRLKVPKTLSVERISILSAPQEDALHFVEVILQTIIILTQHSRTELNLQLMAGKLRHSTDLKATRRLKNLDIDIAAHDLDDLSHQAVTTRCYIADLALQHRPVHTQCDHVGDNSANSSLCHCYLSLFSLNSAGTRASPRRFSIMFSNVALPCSTSRRAQRSLIFNLQK